MATAGLHVPSLRDVRDRDPYPVWLQAREIIRALFAAFPDLERDPEAPAPIYAGYVSRAWRPLHLRHAPRRAEAVRVALAGAAS
jgi:hypothetical protein